MVRACYSEGAGGTVDRRVWAGHVASAEVRGTAGYGVCQYVRGALVRDDLALLVGCGRCVRDYVGRAAGERVVNHLKSSGPNTRPRIYYPVGPA